MFCRLPFFIKTCCNCCCCVYNFITRKITKSSIKLAKYLLFSNYMQQDSKYNFFHINYFPYFIYFFIVIPLLIWIMFSTLIFYLHSHLHDICFVNIFDSFILVIMLKTLRLKSSALFGTHNLLDRSSRVLQLPAHLSKLTANG